LMCYREKIIFMAGSKSSPSHVRSNWPIARFVP
jgi:hypothetical protein